jgi:DNA excision repair protein ERCC-4
MMWDTSAEEDKYLAEVRREKESFEKLIKERAVSPSCIQLADLFTTCQSMVLVLQEKPNPGQDRTEAMIRNISSRNAGGRATVVDPPSVGGQGPSLSTY